MSGDPPHVPRDEAGTPLDHSLERGLQRRPLTPDALARIHGAVEAEWRAATRASRRRPWGRASMLAASIAVLVIAVIGAYARWSRPVTDPAVIGVIERLESPGLEVRTGFFDSQMLSAGESIHVGQTARAFSATLVALTEGGTLRIAPGTVIVAQEPRRIELHAGQLYLDFPPTIAANPFAVQTFSGVIEHRGTQYEIVVGDRDVRVRVREGEVQVRRPAGDVVAPAGTQLVLPANGPVARTAVPINGAEWWWAESLAPEFAIEDRPLIDFLQWVSRETGHRLDFADEHAREVAKRTRLHGSVHGLMPLDALKRVLSTTTLRYELHGDAIWVSSSA